METNFETIAYAMQTRTLNNILAQLRTLGAKVEKDSCAGTVVVYGKDFKVALRAIQVSRQGLGAWIVRARQGLVTVEVSHIIPLA